MILIRANTERQIPVIRATLVSAPLASASKYVYDHKSKPNNDIGASSPALLISVAPSPI